MIAVDEDTYVHSLFGGGFRAIVGNEPTNDDPHVADIMGIVYRKVDDPPEKTRLKFRIRVHKDKLVVGSTDPKEWIEMEASVPLTDAQIVEEIDEIFNGTLKMMREVGGPTGKRAYIDTERRFQFVVKKTGHAAMEDFTAQASKIEGLSVSVASLDSERGRAILQRIAEGDGDAASIERDIMQASRVGRMGHIGLLDKRDLPKDPITPPSAAERDAAANANSVTMD